jgi:DNA (cytosine-5)-methyltransferase 1
MGGSSRRPIAVDVFSGAGGLSLGFEQAGFDVVAAIEYDPIHAIAHRYNFPNCEVLCRDVRNISGPDVRAAAARGFKRIYPSLSWPGAIDALIGGPTCQGFSTGGLREKDDERNDLLLEFVRLVEALKPRTFCFENVPGLLEQRFASFREMALQRLRDAGYIVTGGDSWLNAADYGVPQSRKRVIVMGVLDGPAADLPFATEAGAKVKDAFEGLPVIEDYSALLKSDVTTLRAADQARRVSIKSSYAAELAGLNAAADAIWRPLEISNSLRTVHSPEVIKRFYGTPTGTVEKVSRLYRLDNDSLARTLRAGTGRERGAHTSPRPIHPELPRVITVREAARLHSFPDWFRFNGTNWHGHRQVGNSVPPALARAVAGKLIERLDVSNASPNGRRVGPLGDEAWRTISPSAAATILGAQDSELPAQRSRPIGMDR